MELTLSLLLLVDRNTACVPWQFQRDAKRAVNIYFCYNWNQDVRDRTHELTCAGPQCKCLHMSLLPFSWWLYSHRTGTDTFLIVYFWKMWIVSWNGAFVSSMTTKLVRQRHFHESNECHPSGSELYLTMGIKYTSRGMWPEATQGSELIWLQNRGPVNWNLLFNVFNDRASQNNTCANNTQAHSLATLWILHFRE